MWSTTNFSEYVFSRPMAAAPGTAWKYNSGAPNVVLTIMYKVTTESLADYAQARLFDPL